MAHENGGTATTATSSERACSHTARARGAHLLCSHGREPPLRPRPRGGRVGNFGVFHAAPRRRTIITHHHQHLA